MYASVLAPMTYFRRAWSEVDVGTPANTNETVLKSTSIPANYFGTIGRCIKFKYAGFFSNNANSKTVRLRLGTVTLTGTIICAPTPGAYTNLRWSMEGTIIVRTLPDSQTTEAEFRSNGGTVPNAVQITQVVSAQDDASVLLLELTGQNAVAAANDVVCSHHTVDSIFGAPQQEN